MILDSGQIKCDDCGQFIAVQDIYEGKASNVCVYPDSEFTRETWESCCRKCTDDLFWRQVGQMMKEIGVYMRNKGIFV